MRITITPGPLRGAVRVPVSKSAAHRALICAALADRPTLLRMDGTNDDIEATVRCLCALGARIERVEIGLQVHPIQQTTSSADKPNAARPALSADDPALLDCGESGSTLRFLIPLAAALRVPARFTGEGRLPARPNAALTGALRAHGAIVDADAPPMVVSGSLRPGMYQLPGNISSQYASGLLFALPLLPGPSEILFTSPPESAGYLRMTVDALRAYGVTIHEMVSGYRIPAPQAFVSGGERAIEGDWSAAAFWLVANALGSAISVDGLHAASAQGDREIECLLARFARSESPLVIDASQVPDLVPILAVRAAACPCETRIENAARLRLKESDRLRAMAHNLRALGGDIEETADGLRIDGQKPLTGGAVSAYGDHRIAMAMGIAATLAQGPVSIDGAECVAKSYPAFWTDFERLGGQITYGK